MTLWGFYIDPQKFPVDSPWPAAIVFILFIMLYPFRVV